MNRLFDMTRDKLYQADAIMQLALGAMDNPEEANTVASALSAALELIRDAVKQVDAIEKENK